MTGSEPGQNAPKGQVRFIGDVPGCFVFLDRASAMPEMQAFPFNARSVATTRAVISSAVSVERGERLALHFDAIGIRRGVVERALKNGFIINFTDEGGDAGGVGARIDWLKKKTRGRMADRRKHKRVMPKNPSALLILGAENIIECRIKDMSCSGAAILSPAEPAVGSLLAVGAVPGRVVRHFDGGFAIQFLEMQQLAELEGLLTLSTKRQKAIAARKLGFAA